MSREFHVGAQVVCVDDVYWPEERGDRLEAGRIYTIRKIDPDHSFLDDKPTRALGIWLEEARRVVPRVNTTDPNDCPWGAVRFRPVRKTDISVFTAMLKPVKEDA